MCCDKNQVPTTSARIGVLNIPMELPDHPHSLPSPRVVRYLNLLLAIHLPYSVLLAGEIVSCCYCLVLSDGIQK